MIHIPAAALLARLIGALLSEELLNAASTGEGDEGGKPHLRIDLESSSYLFHASRIAFGSYLIDPETVRRVSRGVLGDDESEPADDPSRFVVDAASILGLTGTTVANYIAELSATLAADVHLAATGIPAKELVELPHPEKEGWLTGHPLLVANKGRLGFSASDCARYAPEACRPLRPVWLAVSRQLAEFRSVPSMSEQGLVDHELGPAVQERFRSVLREAGADPSGYLMLPAHPWQVDHVIRQLWSGSVSVSTDPVPARSWEPDGHFRVLPRKPWHVLRQYLVDALFLGVWGPLGQLLDGHGLPAKSAELWNLTREVITEYIGCHPEQAQRLEATALLGPEFGRYPLNGYRLRMGYTDLDTRPPVPKAGSMPNPMHRP